MQDRTEGRPDDGADWCEFEDLPLETKCKLEGMKILFNCTYYLFLKSFTNKLRYPTGI